MPAVGPDLRSNLLLLTQCIEENRRARPMLLATFLWPAAGVGVGLVLTVLLEDGGGVYAVRLLPADDDSKTLDGTTTVHYPEFVRDVKPLGGGGSGARLTLSDEYTLGGSTQRAVMKHAAGPRGTMELLALAEHHRDDTPR